MSVRFSIVLTDEQAAALRLYAKGRWAKPSDIIRTALFGHLSCKALFRSYAPIGVTSGVSGESSPKIDFGHLSELFKVTLSPEPKTFREKTEKQAFWTLVRAKVFERDGYKCRLCRGDGGGKLHVHHIIKRREGGRDTENNLVTLCPSCHSQADHGMADASGVWSGEGTA